MSKITNITLAISFVCTDQKRAKEVANSGFWIPWIQNLNDNSREYYQSIYHGNFYEQAFVADSKATAFRRWTLNNPKEKPHSLQLDEFQLLLTRIEVFVAESGFSLYTLFFEIPGTLTINELIGLTFKTRNPGCVYALNNHNYTINALLQNIGGFKTEVRNPTHLYTFQNVEYSKSVESMDLKNDCFHLANFIPVEGDSRFKTSADYYQYQLQNFGIDIYQSWFALSLNDSFVRVSQPDADEFKRWETDYFTVYLYNVCLKNYLSFVNSILVQVTNLSSDMEKQKNDFIEFLNDTQYHRISSKFLPNDLFEIIGNSLGVPDEMQVLEKKLERMSAYFEARRTKAFNTALIVITFLSVFSVIFDISLWFQYLGIPEPILWPMGSVITGVIIVLVITVFFIFRLRK